jgi:3-demethoxyubiquinol 3-hydroxylase
MDDLIKEFDRALRTLSGMTQAKRPTPGSALDDTVLKDAQACRHAAGLMRVNHVGEICAQALYRAQGLTSREPELRERFAQAADEEADHLAWCEQRLSELNSRPSWLNPLWYAGAFMLGVLAGCTSKRMSLGFVQETEDQVAEHLARHLNHMLPEQDTRSRAIIAQMHADETMHGDMALAAGAAPLPLPIRQAMRAMAWFMTSTAYYV